MVVCVGEAVAFTSAGWHAKAGRNFRKHRQTLNRDIVRHADTIILAYALPHAITLSSLTNIHRLPGRTLFAVAEFLTSSHQQMLVPVCAS